MPLQSDEWQDAVQHLTNEVTALAGRVEELEINEEANDYYRIIVQMLLLDQNKESIGALDDALETLAEELANAEASGGASANKNVRLAETLRGMKFADPTAKPSLTVITGGRDHEPT